LVVQEQLVMVDDARPATTKTKLAMIAPDLRAVLPKIDVPCPASHGDADVRAPSSVTEALHDQVHGRPRIPKGCQPCSEA
jgi:hypothetical protein